MKSNFIKEKTMNDFYHNQNSKYILYLPSQIKIYFYEISSNDSKKIKNNIK